MPKASEHMQLLKDAIRGKLIPMLITYGVPFVSKLKKFEGLRFMLVFTMHDAGIYDA